LFTQQRHKDTDNFLQRDPLAAGSPIEAMGLLLAVDPIPNAFRTVANVTGMMAVSVLARREADSRRHGRRPGTQLIVTRPGGRRCRCPPTICERPPRPQRDHRDSAQASAS
ncbi:MAG: dicarboxylate/amino acid:cation symporter, partial [Candidatus Moduliflexus flocculans]|nr:dicarboxylate/amino acid:cation symporter [Candidatus Moduliflexus flocculans]